ncbi:MAG: PDZ domain-containing protein [Chloroflexi bacterium AL-W]|nr:PDZ domain-containing protein [Chloroflexi bacterium AL-N1]NOK71240.1 PDZ domain-containing protein [Chloroflexi bacterium AL-N10]NOK76529.1 PDZ domain-containing protein [Chloroflexi bacterium AL-N5]NOK83647.1 PDZ domain-containing protein [Chloroflexi bacterium AL-W]NOK92232.1 PDZ domain-containing protein [Chloroflexi bacterium AL-N15]
MINKTASHPSIEALIASDPASNAVTHIVDQLQPSVVQVRNRRRGGGTGVIWRTDGSIVTNYHVVGNASEVQIGLFDGRTLTATVSDRNPTLDLALLKADTTDLPAAPVDDSSTLQVGELVLAIGHPWGQPWVVTAGIVSGLGNVTITNTNQQVQYIRSDVRLAPGNSGGPLLNARGAVVGINAMIFGGDLSVAIPSHAAITWIAGLPSRRITLGIQVQTVELPGTLRRGSLAQRKAGVMIVGVNPNGPASKATLSVGDVLVDVSGMPVENTAALLEALARRDATEIIKLNVLRGGALTTVDVHVDASEQIV